MDAKELRKNPQNLGSLCYIHRCYDSVITNMIPHNIFLVFLSFRHTGNYAASGQHQCAVNMPVV